MRSIFEHLRISFSILILTLVSASYALVDQYFAAKLSASHVYFLGVAGSISILFLLCARVFGQSLLVAKDDEPACLPSLKLYGLLALVTVSTLPLVSYFEIDLEAVVVGAVDFVRLQVIASWLIGLSLLLKFAHIRSGSVNRAIIIDLFGSVGNAILNSLAIHYAGENAFATLAGATIVSQALVCCALLRGLDLGLTGSVRNYLATARSVLSGETFLAVIQAAAPMVIIWIMGTVYGHATGAAVSIGFAVIFFLERPFTANMMATTRAFGATAVQHRKAIKSAVGVTALWGCFVCLGLFYVPSVVERWYGLQMHHDIVLWMLAGYLPRFLVNPAVAVLRALRCQTRLARLELYLGEGLLVAGVLVLAMNFSARDTVATAFVVPGFLWAVVVLWIFKIELRRCFAIRSQI
jgi:hypothetical protein